MVPYPLVHHPRQGHAPLPEHPQVSPPLPRMRDLTHHGDQAKASIGPRPSGRVLSEPLPSAARLRLRPPVSRTTNGPPPLPPWSSRFVKSPSSRSRTNLISSRRRSCAATLWTRLARFAFLGPLHRGLLISLYHYDGSSERTVRIRLLVLHPQCEVDQNSSLCPFFSLDSGEKIVFGIGTWKLFLLCFDF